MARFENLGYCPNNAFCNYREYNLPGNPLAMKILGGRAADMYYPENDKALANDVSIVSAMLGGDGSLGVQLACYLRHVSPSVSLEEFRPIRIHDVINPKHICADLYCNDPSTCSDWCFPVNGLIHKDDKKTWRDGMFLFEDDDYLVAAKDNEDGIDIWIFQKPVPLNYMSDPVAKGDEE